MEGVDYAGILQGEQNYIFKLPDEILYLIFIALPLSGIVNCSFTCKRWHDIISSSSLLRKKALLRISHQELSEDNSILSAEMKRNIYYTNIFFDWIYFRSDMTHCWETVGPHIIFLKINFGRKVSLDQNWISLFRNLPNLQRLEMCYDEIYLFRETSRFHPDADIKFPKLEEFVLNGNTNFFDTFLKSHGHKMVKLKTFEINSNSDIEQHYCRFHAMENDITAIIAQNVKTLRRLHFNHLNENFANALLCIPDITLKSFQTTKLNSIAKASVIHFLETQKATLEELCIVYVPDMFTFICDSLIHLKILKVHNLGQDIRIIEQNKVSLKHLTKLETLFLKYFYNDSLFAEELAGDLNIRRLHFLNFSFNINESIFDTTVFRNLIALEIEIRYLEMLPKLFQSLDNLEELELRTFYTLHYDSNSRIIEHCFDNISNMSKLRSLVITNFHEITVDNIRKHFHFPLLKYMAIKFFPKLCTNADLITFILNCPVLEFLKISIPLEPDVIDYIHSNVNKYLKIEYIDDHVLKFKKKSVVVREGKWYRPTIVRTIYEKIV